MNNCFSIFTRSDLNRIRKETIKKRLVWLTGEFMREHEAINRCAKVKSLQYLQTWQMIVLPNSEKKNRASFVSVNSPRLRKFSLSLLANAVNRGYDQGERCLSKCFLPCSLARTCNFRQYLPSSFLHKLTSSYRQNWSWERIHKSKNNDKATSFSSAVVNRASSLQKVSYSKPLDNKSCCLNTMKSFLPFKVISTWIFVDFQKGFTMKLWQNTQFTTAILFCFIFTA